MADQTFDSRLELLLRSALAGEVASLPMSVTADQVLERARTRQGGSVVGRLRRLGQSTTGRQRLSFAAAAGSAVVVIVVAGAIGLNFFLHQKPIIGPSATATPAASVTPSPTVVPSEAPIPTSRPSSNLGFFEPVAGRIVYGTQTGIYGVDPATLDPATTTVQLTSEAGTPLGWSRDGTLLLVIREGLLIVIHADGSETQLTDASLAIRGATISPDGSRVVFAGGTNTAQGDCCAEWSLYGVDAVGGAVEMLRPGNGMVEDPTFSPDGTRIAFDDGAGDNNHNLWMMDADGTDAHKILSKDCACHIYGIAWSPTGDRIAFGLEGTIYTFATDGSALTPVIANGNQPFWSPDGSQLAYTVACLQNANGCGLGLADADGSNATRFGPGESGPWHPGAPATPITQPSPAVGPTSAPSPAEPVPTPVQPISGEVPLGWSSGGTRLLIQRNLENLFIRNADGSEMQVTEQLSGFSGIPGSARPSGATISPDGSRVVFAGLTRPWQDGRSCHDGGLFAVDADGGPAELLWESQVAQNGIVRDPTFSPDGTQIAFADGYCDSSHSAWVMNADGTDAHQIVPTDFGPLGATHVHGVAWSAAGDRIALWVDDGVYAFALDGSGFAPISDSSDFCWTWNQC